MKNLLLEQKKINLNLKKTKCFRKETTKLSLSSSLKLPCECIFRTEEDQSKSEENLMF